jgi:diguanylate cyclase (GGDEF)-like protein
MTVPPLRSITAALERARLAYWEQPAEALEVAIRCQEQARLLGLPALQSRALALQGAVSLHVGDLRGAFALAAEADRLAGDDLFAHTELAALNTHLHFFSGAYGESLRWAMDAVERADITGDPALRLHARRMACLAFGNVGVDDLEQRFNEVLELAVELDSPWEQAVAHNDLAHHCMVQEDFAAAGAHLAQGLALAGRSGTANFLYGILHATRSQVHLACDRPEAALDDARCAVTHVGQAARDANPYLLGMVVLTEVSALLALGEVEAARDTGERALKRLGDRVPQAGGMILSAVAAALREAGRAEEAYDALARAAELEREALREFSQLQVGLERARLEAEATRREADALGAKNRQLEALLSELAAAQDQLRDQADRDWLTGVHNRRFLARTSEAPEQGHLSLAVVDLDHFKAINDRFGHQVGDHVLVRVAELLVGHLRDEDIVVRTGGEEFAVLMPHAREAEAAACCERLRAVIAGEPWGAIAVGLAVTASIGVVSAADCRDIRDLERLADERLYAAKRGGRDRVEHGLAAA